MRKSEISFLFVDNSEIAILNKLCFSKERPTDVIAFPQGNTNNPVNPDRPVLGDVVISVEMAKEQARSYKKTFFEELKLLIIHGTLHLLGFDDIDPKKRSRMRAMERKLLGELKSL